MGDEAPAYPSIDILYAEALRVMKVQEDAAKQLETKASLIVAFAGVVATNLPALTANRPMLILATASAMATFILGGFAMKTITFGIGPKLSVLRDDFLKAPLDDTKLVFVDTVLDQVEPTWVAIDNKATLLNWELFCFVATVVFIVVGRVYA